MSRVQCKSYGSVLLFVFVLMAIGSVPGFAWCVGEDGHVKIECSATGECCDDASELTSEPKSSGDQSVLLDQNYCGQCLDLILQTHVLVSANRFHYDSVFAALCSSKDINTVIPSAAKLLVGNLLPHPPPRITQALLDHCTIVLLI